MSLVKFKENSEGRINGPPMSHSTLDNYRSTTRNGSRSDRTNYGPIQAEVILDLYESYPILGELRKCQCLNSTNRQTAPSQVSPTFHKP